jgi:hypothetical protein
MAANSLEIRERGKQINVPAMEVSGTNVIVTGRWIKIASVHDEEYLENGLQDPEFYINRLKEQGSKDLKADIFTFTQSLPDTKPRYPYPVEWDNVAAIRLSSFEEWWRSGISVRARQDIKRSAKRGVVTTVTEFNDDLVRGIVEIYNESAIRQGKPFWHYQSDFDTVRRENATYLERSVFIGAYYNDELIGFTKIVYVGKVAAMMQFVSKISHFDKRSSNALVAKAVEHSAKMGMSYLTYGKYRYGNITSSLTQFKHRMGFEEIFIPQFYVPLTFAGQMTIHLGLHRSLADYIPEPVLAQLRKLRSLWHGRKFQVAKPL